MKANKPFNPEDTCRLVIKESETQRHQQVLLMPDGTEIPKIVWTRVYDHFEEPSYIIAKIYINISAE